MRGPLIWWREILMKIYRRIINKTNECDSYIYYLVNIDGSLFWKCLTSEDIDAPTIYMGLERGTFGANSLALSIPFLESDLCE